MNDPWRVERRRSVWREAVPGDLSESESAKVDVATDRFGEMHPRSFYLPKMKVTSCLWAKQRYREFPTTGLPVKRCKVKQYRIWSQQRTKTRGYGFVVCML